VSAGVRTDIRSYRETQAKMEVLETHLSSQIFELRATNSELTDEITQLQKDVVQLQQHITFLQAMRAHNKSH